MQFYKTVKVLQDSKIKFIAEQLAPALAVTCSLNQAKLNLGNAIENKVVEEKIKSMANDFIIKEDLELDPQKVAAFCDAYFAVSKFIQAYLRKKNEVEGYNEGYKFSHHEAEHLTEIKKISGLASVASLADIAGILKQKREEKQDEMATAIRDLGRDVILKTNDAIYQGMHDDNKLLINRPEVYQQLSESISAVFMDKTLCKELKEGLVNFKDEKIEQPLLDTLADTLCACALEKQHTTSPFLGVQKK